MAQFDVYQRDHNTTAVANDDSQAISYASGTLLIDPANGSLALVTLTANVTAWTLVSSNLQPGQWVSIVFIQDATGSRTLSGLTNSNIKWPNTTYLGTTGGSAPTLSTGANKRDTIVLRWDGTNFTVASIVFNQ